MTLKRHINKNAARRSLISEEVHTRAVAIVRRHHPEAKRVVIVPYGGQVLAEVWGKTGARLYRVHGADEVPA